MLLLQSNRSLDANEGGHVSVSYVVSDEVGSACNDRRDVISTVLDYDIEGNHSMLTLPSNAVTFAGADVTLAYVVTDDGQGRLQATRAMKRTVAGATEDVDLGESGDAVGAVFANVYPDPSDPTTPQRPFARERGKAGTLPRTGDDGTWSAWASVVATLGLALRRQAAR